MAASGPLRTSEAYFKSGKKVINDAWEDLALPTTF